MNQLELNLLLKITTSFVVLLIGIVSLLAANAYLQKNKYIDFIFTTITGSISLLIFIFLLNNILQGE